MYIVELQDPDTSFYVAHSFYTADEAYDFAAEMAELGYVVLDPERMN